MTNAQIWIAFGIAAWAASLYYAYSLGWWKGNTAAYKEVRTWYPSAE